MYLHARQTPLLSELHPQPCFFFFHFTKSSHLSSSSHDTERGPDGEPLSLEGGHFDNHLWLSGKWKGRGVQEDLVCDRLFRDRPQIYLGMEEGGTDADTKKLPNLAPTTQSGN